MPDAPSPLPLAQRVWLLLTQAALVLPFVTARDCANGAVTDYTGVGLYTHDDNIVSLVPLAIVTIVLIAFPYRATPIPRALAPLGLRAFVVGFGLLLAVAVPGILLLFEKVTHHVGWYLHVGGWGALYAALILGAGTVLARGGGGRPSVREQVAIGALLVAPPLNILGKSFHDEVTADLVLWVLAVGYTMVVPLVLMGLGLARERADGVPDLYTRVLWWGLVALTLLVHLTGAVAD